MKKMMAVLISVLLATTSMVYADKYLVVPDDFTGLPAYVGPIGPQGPVGPMGTNGVDGTNTYSAYAEVAVTASNVVSGVSNGIKDSAVAFVEASGTSSVAKAGAAGFNIGGNAVLTNESDTLQSVVNRGNTTSNSVYFSSASGDAVLAIGTNGGSAAKLYVKGASGALTNVPLVLIEGSVNRNDDALRVTENGGAITNFRVSKNGVIYNGPSQMIASNGFLFSGNNPVLTNAPSGAYADVAGTSSNVVSGVSNGIRDLAIAFVEASGTSSVSKVANTVASGVTNVFDGRYLGINSNAASATYASTAGNSSNVVSGVSNGIRDLAIAFVESTGTSAVSKVANAVASGVTNTFDGRYLGINSNANSATYAGTANVASNVVSGVSNGVRDLAIAFMESSGTSSVAKTGATGFSIDGNPIATNAAGLELSNVFSGPTNKFVTIMVTNLIQTAGGWDDLVCDANNVRVQGGTEVANDYVSNCVTFTTGANTNFDNDHVFFTIQFPHAWKTGSVVYPHIHFVQSAVNQTNNMWFMRYKWYSIGQQVPSTWIELNSGTNALSFTTGLVHQLADFELVPGAGVSGAGKGLSSLMDVKIYRRGNIGSNTVQMKQFDIHIQKDSLGSDGIVTKSF